MLTAVETLDDYFSPHSWNPFLSLHLEASFFTSTTLFPVWILLNTSTFFSISNQL
ncbi:unnamed protein product [Musa hybrid cultivar]